MIVRDQTTNILFLIEDYYLIRVHVSVEYWNSMHSSFLAHCAAQSSWDLHLSGTPMSKNSGVSAAFVYRSDPM